MGGMGLKLIPVLVRSLLDPLCLSRHIAGPSCLIATYYEINNINLWLPYIRIKQGGCE